MVIKLDGENDNIFDCDIKKTTEFYTSHLVFKQTDIWLKTEDRLNSRQAEEFLKQAYLEIEQYIASNMDFLSSLHPIEVPEKAPNIVKQMCMYSIQAGVGPMAGVAGAISEFLGQKLSSYHRQIFCNNGGDIYYKTTEEQQVLLSAPGSPFHNRIKISMPSAINGKGLCTSSGISGHSINMGRAFSVTILANNACLADVWATSISNQVRSDTDIEHGLELCKKQEGIEGTVILVDQSLGAWGDISLDRIK